jgi:nucleotide-binding universal stress UspA family protein
VSLANPSLAHSPALSLFLSATPICELLVMKALIAVDGSSGGFEAVRQTGQVLQPGRDQVILYYSPPGIKLDNGSVEPEVLERARASLATAVFQEAKSLLPEALQAGVETILGRQPPKQGIVAAAESSCANLIAVGARGLGPIERLLLGSVSSSVVHAARVPVLVARPRGADRQQQPLQVLVACESVSEDGYLADIIKTLHWPAGTQGFAVSVVQSMFAGSVPTWLEERARSEEVEAMARAWVAEHEAEIKSKRAELAAFTASLPEPFRTTKPIVVEGHPADQILATIAEQKIDLVMMGSRTPSPMERFLVGSASQTVLNHAPCSVLIVRDTGNG